MIKAQFNENGLANGETVGPTCNKQQCLPAKKIALRDVQNEARNLIKNLQAAENSPLSKEREPDKDALNATGGIKRQKPECPVGPALCQSPYDNGEKRPKLNNPEMFTCQSPRSNDTNGHLVYVRRKAESDQAKNSDFQPSTQQGSHGRQSQVQKSNVSSLTGCSPIQGVSMTTMSCGVALPPDSLARLGNGPAGFVANHTAITGSPLLKENTQSTFRRHWKDRYEDLQKYLKICDESSREDYVRMLRSLSAAERSKHAVALEERAIRLSIVEANEFQRIKALNIMNKSTDGFNSSPLSTVNPGEVRQQNLFV